MRAWIARALLLVAALGSAGFNVIRDPNGNGPILWGTPAMTYQIQQDGSDDVGDGSDIAAIRSALETWNRVPCSAFRFTDGGLTASRSIGADGVNRIAFLESNWPGGADGAAAYTVRERNGATWTEADIRVNGVDFEWSTTGDIQRPDLQSVIVHELGHALGLMHSADPEATMFYAVRRGTTQARTLHPDDVAGACYLYPSAARPCGADPDCPIFWASYGGANYRSRCEGGSCVAGSARTYAAECFEAVDCASGLCLIDPTNPPASEPGFCSQTCSAGTCPNGDFCEQGRCIVGRDDCVGDADCGGANRVCARDLDGRFRCLRLCLQDSVCFMTPGAVCHGGTGANPAGFCRVPGPGAPGAVCDHGLECTSLACTAGDAVPTCAAGTPGFTGDGGVQPPRDGGAPGADARVTPGADAGTPARDAAPAADGSSAGADADLSSGALDGSTGGSPGTGPLIGGCGCSSAPPRHEGATMGTWLAILAASGAGRLRARRRRLRSDPSSTPPLGR
ncbi:MAG: matrixin family metalloprotease [Deltaproteobacteria bacterium]|nr:matrixin family metalloprotease [Deltaproteobacteria bacterium]